MHFDADKQQNNILALSDNLAVNGLAISEDNFLILDKKNERGVVLHYQVEGHVLEHQGS
ncbi:hypothetical protein [Pseudoalteromonas phenolica]|uniref:hypothetical protein n=1 Tax=Pseudoalteromonas phenolica TaxID=161398 RepID=UPI0013EE45A1|nr:hypothetical protein [Pseudoalteromonas phenolica]